MSEISLFCWYWGCGEKEKKAETRIYLVVWTDDAGVWGVTVSQLLLGKLARAGGEDPASRSYCTNAPDLQPLTSLGVDRGADGKV